MRISDWSSDVCSSDLFVEHHYIRRIRKRTESEAGRPADILVLIERSDFDTGYGERSVDLVGAELRSIHLDLFGQKVEHIAEPLAARSQLLPSAPVIDRAARPVGDGAELVDSVHSVRKV